MYASKKHEHFKVVIFYDQALRPISMNQANSQTSVALSRSLWLFLYGLALVLSLVRVGLYSAAHPIPLLFNVSERSTNPLVYFIVCSGLRAA